MTTTMPSPRLLAVATPRWDDHLAHHGALPLLSSEALIAEVGRAGLTGRGGAGFPVERKLAAVARSSARHGRPVIIANGSEGEALSAKDAVLLTSSPHLVLDGLLACAAALDARAVHLVVDEKVMPQMRRALDERPDAGYVELRAAAGGFVGGEASALVASLRGGRPVPVDRRERLAVRGLHRAPTLVQNVETLAAIGLIVRVGADHFRSVGTADEPGTRLVSVSGPSRSPVVFETVGGTPLRALLEAAEISDVNAVLVGGYHGAWVGQSALDAPLSPTGLAPHGAAVGAGILHAIGSEHCGIAVTGDILRVLADASAGQCGPCANGLPAVSHAWEALGSGVDTRAELSRLAGLVAGRGACHHPDGSIRMMGSALRVFADDAAAHARGLCFVRQGVDAR
ncbi:NADH-ubiquinone oxidoreductase-F iron-sulfur binding region domain-containing protein [Microbacterium sp. RG1]|uniref:NADH-ubiquinone oxidoreductase-F iron-sulfur binding region domain-containing protein n=1 Tax=Microbacterium sp. RG1 TaxID=2489212 RepID=UPI001375CBB0|nr:NADH-ubiquinone oxidoreductase-F iron-sulfur binding region domain-containing protein [Microbacterium sp. RG1]